MAGLDENASDQLKSDNLHFILLAGRAFGVLSFVTELVLKKCIMPWWSISFGGKFKSIQIFHGGLP